MPRTDAARALVAVLLLAACDSLAPDYAPPTMEVGSSFKESGLWRVAGRDVPPAGKWWALFGDPVLNGLEERIEAANPALAAAAARYRQADAILRHNRADELPEIDLGGGLSRSRVSAARPLTNGRAETYHDVTLGASLSYEVDLFGRVASAVAAGEANAVAAKSDLAGVRLGLQTRLAGLYFDLRGLDARIALLGETVEAYRRAYDLTDTRHGDGIASGLDLSRARTQLASARAELETVAAQRDRTEHAIAALLGEVPSRFSIAASATELSPPPIPAGVPSALLERRPDIAAAERRVAAANAEIGVARAAMYPRVTLGLTGGFETIYGNLLDASNGVWSLGPLAVNFPLFDHGARQANLDLARARYEEIVAAYRQTVLTAFREVEDDLVTARHAVEQERNQREAAAAARVALDLALTRYRDGAADYLQVVTAQTTALDAERTLLDLHSQQLHVATDTVRALGGL
ncbi:MAG: hypothetical protein RLZZ501_1495 [Pseudomonadota bacterium]|jgi:multidrug efflux system outer membrane protein